MEHILVVDDEVNIRKVVREYAEFEGYEVTEAENGMEAVNLCHENDYDLIIMDVMMPRLDGYSACKEIHKTKKIPVIMLSASAVCFFLGRSGANSAQGASVMSFANYIFGFLN